MRPAVRGVCSPHALLVRSWPEGLRVTECSWWRKFWDESEVRAALALQRSNHNIRTVDEFAEHPESRPSHDFKGRFRLCEMSESFDRGGHYQRQFDRWLWESFYSNPHMLPSLGCLVNMVRLKQVMWNRYGLFFDVDTIQEVYPESELAEWVIKAYEADEIATPIYRDECMAYEVRSALFENPQPTQIRTYREEMIVQHRRRLFRESRVEYDSGGVLWFDSRLTRRIYEGEVLPRSLLEEDAKWEKERGQFWERRRNPLREQHDAGEPDRAKWCEFVAEHEKADAVS